MFLPIKALTFSSIILSYFFIVYFLNDLKLHDANPLIWYLSKHIAHFEIPKYLNTCFKIYIFICLYDLWYFAIDKDLCKIRIISYVK